MIEDTQDIEVGEIYEFIGEQTQGCKDVNVNSELNTEQKQEITRLLFEFADIFTDVRKVTKAWRAFNRINYR